jgi:hypothetical protein
MLPIQVEIHSPVCPPAQLQRRQWLAFERKDHGEVPTEDVHLQASPPGHQRIQKTAQFYRQRALLGVRHETDPTVDVPAHDENRLLGLLGSGRKRGKIRRTINQEGGPLGAGDAPTIPPFG